ncbi:MAG: hypothetical protein HOI23_10670 [Deltaproteobacteria bacterium]|nr:hypothetical protein [Deltaproteobacteria bacterium]
MLDSKYRYNVSGMLGYGRYEAGQPGAPVTVPEIRLLPVILPLSPTI